MSWDVLVMRCPEGARVLDDIPEGWNQALGTGAEVRAVLTVQLPAVRFAVDGWADFDGVGFSLETCVDAPDDAAVRSLMLSVRGSAEDAQKTVLAVAAALEARPYAIGEGFLDLEDPDDSAEYRAAG
jgi:hypothetical protein